MKRFRFRLERVLQYRELVKRDLRRDLMFKTNLLMEARQRLTALERAWEENEVAGGRIHSVEMLQLLEAYGRRLKIEVAQQREKVEQCTQALEEARTRYIAAAKEAEALQTLKRKKREEYLEAYYKEEGAFLDEISVQRAKHSGPLGSGLYDDEVETEWDDAGASRKTV